MTPNNFQKRIIESERRVTVITSEPGAGTTTGLFMAIAEEAIKSGPGSLVLYVRRTMPQSTGSLDIALKALPPARYSDRSNIITFDGPDGEYKIKLVDSDYVNDPTRFTGVAAIAFDMHVEPSTALAALIAARKVFFADRIGAIAGDGNNWGSYCRIVHRHPDGGYFFTDQVSHVVGLIKENPNVGHDYMCALLGLPDVHKKDLFQIYFPQGVDTEK